MTESKGHEGPRRGDTWPAGWSQRARGCEQAAGRRHMDRHIIKNRTGYLLLRGEREGEEEEEERDREGREGACVTKGEQ